MRRDDEYEWQSQATKRAVVDIIEYGTFIGTALFFGTIAACGIALIMVMTAVTIKSMWLFL